jgi:hypothetical protein
MQGYHVLNRINLGCIKISDKDWQKNGNEKLAIFLPGFHWFLLSVRYSEYLIWAQNGSCSKFN